MIAPEVMLLYPENSDFFNYIRSIIGDWDYYISEAVEIDAVAVVSLQAGENVQVSESQCVAYIYGWMPGSVEWIEGSCVAVVYFSVPKLTLAEVPPSVTVAVQVEAGEQLIFNTERAIKVLHGPSNVEESQDTP